MNTDKIKLFAAAVILFAAALGTPSCSDDAEYVKAQAILLTPDNTTLLINTTATLVAEVFPIGATDKGVTWASDNPSVASVDGNGLVSALSEGTATITVTAVGNEKRKKTCTVNVIPTLNVVLDYSALGLPAGGATRTLNAAILPDNLDQEVTWSSDNEAVATVDDDGVITTVAPGTATITAASVINEGRTASCIVTVRDVSAMPSGRQLAGIWMFDDGNDLVKAFIGKPLIRQGDGFSYVEGPSVGNGAVRIAKGSSFRTLHDMAANGGGNRVNNFTLMVDFKVSELGRYYCFIQTTLENSDDGDFFLRPAGNLGIGGTGYSEHVVSPGEWHRLVLSASMGNAYLTYLDGVLIHTGNLDAATTDSRFSWLPEGVLLFADEDGEDAEIDIAEVRIWDGALDAGQVGSLGRVQ